MGETDTRDRCVNVMGYKTPSGELAPYCSVQNPKDGRITDFLTDDQVDTICDRNYESCSLYNICSQSRPRETLSKNERSVRNILNGNYSVPTTRNI